MAPPFIVYPEVAFDLNLAVVAASHAPLLLLEADLRIVAASTSFCQIFRTAPTGATSRRIHFASVHGWHTPDFQSELNASIAGCLENAAFAISIDSPFHGRRHLILTVHKLDEAAGANRFFLSATDVTDVHVVPERMEELLVEKTTLLREIQHRLGNHFQLIANVLLKEHLQARSSVPACERRALQSQMRFVIQRRLHLIACGPRKVKISPFLTRLCQNISDGMIQNRGLALIVCADESVVSGDVCVGLGLITTELVMKALARSFPAERNGTIRVDYHKQGLDWTLTVSDTRFGMISDATRADHELGQSMVEALAARAGATLEATSNASGNIVTVSFNHMPVAVGRASAPRIFVQ